MLDINISFLDLFNNIVILVCLFLQYLFKSVNIKSLHFLWIFFAMAYICLMLWVCLNK